MRTADDELAGGINVILDIVRCELGGDRVGNDLIDDEIADLVLRHAGGMLGRHDDRINGDGPVAVVPDRDLALAVGAKPVDFAMLAGIGQAIAIRFGQEGSNVAINYRKGFEEAQQTEASIKAANAGGKTVLVQGDVSHEADVDRMFAETIAALGGVDILINNAGFQIAVDSDQISIDSFDAEDSFNVDNSVTDNSVDTQDNDVDIDAGLI